MSGKVTWSTEPVYNEQGRRICALDGCSRKHWGHGLCSLHGKRWKSHGDPHRRSRFTSEEEKAAFIAAQIEERRQRRARERKEYEAQQEHLRLLRARSVSKIRPQAVDLVRALDDLPEAERAAVASLFAAVLLGQPVEDLIAARTSR